MIFENKIGTRLHLSVFYTDWETLRETLRNHKGKLYPLRKGAHRYRVLNSSIFN